MALPTELLYVVIQGGIEAPTTRNVVLKAFDVLSLLVIQDQKSSVGYVQYPKYCA
ncbi:hypothetical protein AS4_26970 [Acinetobacter guillouiae]|uniref:hypothetical protein n=1 Tax=Acinetobacter guillouiae TaxID=106649 RepID=UPI0004EF6799|nr:hypothetical protein [Acinetobacter guillouiae]BAP37637.1 hypothetical protein AS4_26970 [Acinetobacter guillouiae]